MELARQGARTVIIVDRDRAGATETAQAVRAAGAQAAVYQVDVTDEKAINDLAAQVATEHGVVDILINNAGIGMAGRFWRPPPSTGTPSWGSTCAG
ncbi:putative oxidoreductase EphD [Mycobacterium talmoniae]|uniref:Putative oxidoreductase EphD n=1 Tax=Mycobacterium talmoniae TaxID=1858794 RepID=A0A2S8BHE5_9MYCO|nr:putative oxidoreductase EphD [Mycobacterium talmoniae]